MAFSSLAGKVMGTGGRVGVWAADSCLLEDVRGQTGRLINMEDGAEERGAASVPDYTITLKKHISQSSETWHTFTNLLLLQLFPFVVRNSEHFHI